MRRHVLKWIENLSTDRFLLSPKFHHFNPFHKPWAFYPVSKLSKVHFYVRIDQLFHVFNPKTGVTNAKWIEIRHCCWFLVEISISLSLQWLADRKIYTKSGILIGWLKLYIGVDHAFQATTPITDQKVKSSNNCRQPTFVLVHQGKQLFGFSYMLWCIVSLYIGTSKRQLELLNSLFWYW